MANKKYTLMLGLLGLISTASFAQEGTATAVPGTVVTTQETFVGTDADNSWIYNADVVRDKDQQARFVSGSYPYPPKPRNMWELSVGVGTSFLFTPIDPRLGYGATISLRKALGSVFSLRPQYGYHIAYGQDYRLRPTSDAIPSVQKKLGSGQYVGNFKMTLHQASLDLIASLNTISGYRGNPKTNWYAILGYSFNAAQSAVNTTTSTAKNFTGFNWDRSRGDIRKDVNDVFGKEENPFFTVNDNKRYDTRVDDGRNGTRDDAVGSKDYIVRHEVI